MNTRKSKNLPSNSLVPLQKVCEFGNHTGITGTHPGLWTFPHLLSKKHYAKTTFYLGASDLNLQTSPLCRTMSRALCHPSSCFLGLFAFEENWLRARLGDRAKWKSFRGFLLCPWPRARWSLKFKWVSGSQHFASVRASYNSVPVFGPQSQRKLAFDKERKNERRKRIFEQAIGLIETDCQVCTRL